MYFRLSSNNPNVTSVFECWVSGVNTFCVCQLSGGGGEKRKNKDYLTAQQLFLERLASKDMKISEVALVSGRKATAPYDERRLLDLTGLPPQDEVAAYRIAVNRAAKDIGRNGTAPGGSRMKKLLYEVVWQGEGKLLESDLLLALGFKAETPDKDALKYDGLGKFLEAQDADEVVLSFSAIEGMVGSLPKSARTAQFWANVQKFHWSRRKQWLLRGYEAFWEPKEAQVRFLRADQPTEIPTLLAARIEHQRKRLRARGGEECAPPRGSRKPRKLTSTVYRYQRSASIVAWILEKARGACEGCSNIGPFVDINGNHYLEVHHIRPLAEGGPDTVDNAAALCPGCHRELHYGFDRDQKRTALLNTIDRLVDHPHRAE